MTDWPRLARSRALLIGTTVSAGSGFPPVTAVAGSLGGMKAVLTDPALCGWPDSSVAVIPDARDPAALGLALRDLAAEADDVLLFYFAGHGFVVTARNLGLLPGQPRRDDPHVGGTRPAAGRTGSPVAVTGLARRLLAEFTGTGLLVAVVVGSGIMAARPSPGQPGLELLENTLATVAGLAVIIVVLENHPGAVGAGAHPGTPGSTSCRRPDNKQTPHLKSGSSTISNRTQSTLTD